MGSSLLDGVLAVTRDLRGSVALEQTLCVLAEAVVDLLGFGAAAFNVVTDEGDMRVDAVVGPPSAQTLLGTRCSVQQWLAILSACETWGELYFHGRDFDQSVFDGVASWIPPDRSTAEAGVWHPEDSLFAPLWDAERSLIGVLSVDQPRSGQRPDAQQRTALEVFASQAAHAISDAAARAEIEKTRATAESKWRLAFEHNPTPAALVSIDGSVMEANQALCSLLGYSSHELTRKRFADITHPDDLLDDLALFASLAAGGRDHYALEKRYLRRDGTTIDGLLHVGAIRNRDGTISTIIGQISDITERKVAQARLAYQQTHDLLTGLPNHASVMAVLASALGTKDGAAVLFCDIDRFGLINDALGRPVGDQLLVAVAGRLRDLLPPECRLARIGDDEFLIVGPGYTQHRINALGERVMEAMRRSCTVDGQEYTVSLSIGTAKSGPRSRHPDELVADARHALRRAKRHGRARNEYHDRSRDRVNSLADLQLTQELRRAIEAGGLELHLQPIVSLGEEAVGGAAAKVGAEALIRWRHATRGLLGPAAFLPMAEHAGLMSDLGWHALSLAAQLAALDVPDAPSTGWISVNVSGSQLGRGKLPAVLRTVLSTNTIESSQLRLEITETALADASKQAVNELREVADMGISVGLDDFGTGYSSLSLLRDLPISVILGLRQMACCPSESRYLPSAIRNRSRRASFSSFCLGCKPFRECRWRRRRILCR